uniref:Uncharacterized protein n=1 Tax=Arundo donax TaxID=35708 RepID=A0A0A9D4Y7_ARUDO
MREQRKYTSMPLSYFCQPFTGFLVMGVRCIRWLSCTHNQL